MRFIMRVQDVHAQGHRTRVRHQSQGGKRHDLPCQHTLEA
jgi:hypothetical protein